MGTIHGCLPTIITYLYILSLINFESESFDSQFDSTGFSKLYGLKLNRSIQVSFFLKSMSEDHQICFTNMLPGPVQKYNEIPRDYNWNKTSTDWKLLARFIFLKLPVYSSKIGLRIFFCYFWAIAWWTAVWISGLITKRVCNYSFLCYGSIFLTLNQKIAHYM